MKPPSAVMKSNGNATQMRGSGVAPETAIFHSRGGGLARLARDVMTADPVCCSPTTTLDQVARLMAQNDCGEIPILNENGRVVGVVTDRDIICRVVADGVNPRDFNAAYCMSEPVFTVAVDTPIDAAAPPT